MTRRRRAHLLRGYVPVLAIALVLGVTTALAGPAPRAELAVDLGGPGAAATTTGPGAPPDAAGLPASGATAATSTVTRAGQGAAGPPIGTVSRCADRAEQVPGDPYSPPCIAFTGYNGGATTRGVTKDAIRVSVRLPAEAASSGSFGQVQQMLSQYGIHETLDDLLRTAYGLADYFARNFQFYGRRIVPVIWQGSGLATQEIVGGGQDAANADAIHAAELNVFADVSAITPPYADALVKQRIIAVGAPYMSRAWYAARAPYAWGATPDCSIIAETAAEVAVKYLINRPADHAGGDLHNRPRKLGLIAPDVPWYQDCVNDGIRRIRQAGGDFASVVAYSISDLSTFTTQAGSLVAKLKDQGITSVACACDPVLPLFLTAKATEQNYFPEWFVLGTALTDTDVIGQLYDQAQWQHAAGISLIGPQQPLRASLGYRAYKSVRSDEPSQAVDLIYYAMEMAAIAIQMAGPDLTPQTFQHGLFAYPEHTGPAGTIGFHPGQYTPFNDAMLIWWDRDATSPFNGKRGAYLSDGRRFRPGQWPSQPMTVYRQEYRE